jgi:signal peptidase II
MIQSLKLRLVALTSVLALTVGCDQVSKHVARTLLDPAESIPLLGGFAELILRENPGSFLSLGASLPEPIRRFLLTFAVGVSLVALLIYIARNGARLGLLFFAALALIWAGGTSNLIDRIVREGHVTDFLILRLGPLQTGVFNAADVIIVVGALALAVSIYRAPSEKSKDDLLRPGQSNRAHD